MNKNYTKKQNSKRVLPLREVEAEAIKNALKVFDGNIYKAAYALEISPSTLYRKLKKQKEIS